MLKPLRSGPFEIIGKISDITHETVNQDGYTSHIHRNHLVPYYPKEPIIFTFIQQYNLHSNDHENDKNTSNVNDPIKSSNPFSGEEQLVEHEDHPFTDFNKETNIQSTIDCQQETFNQFSPFPYNQKTNNTNPEYQSDIHDYDNYINPRRHAYDVYTFRPQPRKDYRLFLGEKDILSFSQNPAERKLASKQLQILI